MFKVKDDIISSFKSIEPKYFDLITNLNNPLGKGVRTRYTFYLSRLFDIDQTIAIKIASASELVHLASLLHDDCVDMALKRRDNETINSKYGINIAILAGDMVVSLGFKKARSVSCDLAISLVDFVEKMVEGALFEENLKYKIIGEKEYKEIVSLKTSSLFKWITYSLAFISGYNNFRIVENISESFGLSFQIIDDVLDIEDNNATGKDSFKDLIEGKITYPLIKAMDEDGLKEKVKSFFNDREDLTPAFEIKRYLVENNYTEKSRNDAQKLVIDLKNDLLEFNKKDAAVDFFNFMYSLTNRRS